MAAQFALTAFGAARPGIVLHEDNKDDADFATAYKTAYEAQGGKISVLRRFNPDVDESLTAAFAGLDLAGASHVVGASDSRRSATRALATWQQQPAATRSALLAPGAWLDNPYLGVGQLSAPGLYFVHPKYYDDQGPGYRRFRQLYLQRQHLPPSLYANTGFELLLYFGEELAQYGSALPAALAAAPPTPGAVFDGQSYTGGAHDNQVVPLVKLANLEVQVLR